MGDAAPDSEQERRDGLQQKTACVVLIGDELLSGRTQDANLPHIATWLNRRGIRVGEARIVPDDEAVIVATINAVRHRYDYVFTTGGIGPTHDDITADSIATAFGVGIDHHPEALKILERRYGPDQFTETRKRMARIPHGATLINNPVSQAPGFRIGNVFVMAGIPAIMQAMLESLQHELVGGRPMESRTVSTFTPESHVADGLGALQTRFDQVSFGSYPFYGAERFGTSIVIRSADPAVLEEATECVRQLIRDLGGEPIDGDPRTSWSQQAAAPEPPQ